MLELIFVAGLAGLSQNITMAIRNNLSLMMQGVASVLPIFSLQCSEQKVNIIQMTVIAGHKPPITDTSVGLGPLPSRSSPSPSPSQAYATFSHSDLFTSMPYTAVSPAINRPRREYTWPMVQVGTAQSQANNTKQRVRSLETRRSVPASHTLTLAWFRLCAADYGRCTVDCGRRVAAGGGGGGGGADRFAAGRERETVESGQRLRRHWPPRAPR